MEDWTGVDTSSVSGSTFVQNWHHTVTEKNVYDIRKGVQNYSLDEEATYTGGVCDPSALSEKGLVTFTWPIQIIQSPSGL